MCKGVSVFKVRERESRKRKHAFFQRHIEKVCKHEKKKLKSGKSTFVPETKTVIWKTSHHIMLHIDVNYCASVGTTLG